MLTEVFRQRSNKLERIDTGDYTEQEYQQFLVDIRKVNRLAGDSRALRKWAAGITGSGRDKLRILDVGAGSGELLREFADAVKGRGRLSLVGLEKNELSSRSIVERSKGYPIHSIQGDALDLPFTDNSFHYVISSLFAHHLTDRQIVRALKEMSRVSSLGVLLIDLHRHPAAYASYKLFCSVFRISRLVREDGSLSILRGFRSEELLQLANLAGLKEVRVDRSFPFRLVLNFQKNGGGNDNR